MKTTVLLSQHGRKIRITYSASVNGKPSLTTVEDEDVREIAFAHEMLLIYTGDQGILQWAIPLGSVAMIQRVEKPSSPTHD